MSSGFIFCFEILLHNQFHIVNEKVSWMNFLRLLHNSEIEQQVMGGGSERIAYISSANICFGKFNGI